MINTSFSLIDYIGIYEGIICLEDCQTLINYYEESPDKFEGTINTSSGSALNEDLKKVMEVALPVNSPEDLILADSTQLMLNDYSKRFPWYPSGGYYGTRIRIKKYIPNSNYFNWHVDSGVIREVRRLLGIIWYLNDVEEGGSTEFSFGLNIKPKSGNAIVFPASWLFPHRGNIPLSGPKYAATQFIGYEDVI